MFDSVQPHRSHSPPGSPIPGNTGVGCHFLLQCMKEKSESEVAQSCLTLCDPMDCSPPGYSPWGRKESDTMDCSPPGSSIHGILQARILEWVAISFSRGSSPGLPGSSLDPDPGINLSLLHCRQTLYHLTEVTYQIRIQSISNKKTTRIRENSR